MTIHVLENFLQPYVELHLHTWSKHLRAAEFTTNNAINVSKGYTPFYLNAGGGSSIARELIGPPWVNFQSSSAGCYQPDEGSTRRSETQLGQGTREDKDSSGQDQERGRVEGR